MFDVASRASMALVSRTKSGIKLLCVKQMVSGKQGPMTVPVWTIPGGKRKVLPNGEFEEALSAAWREAQEAVGRGWSLAWPEKLNEAYSRDPDRVCKCVDGTVYYILDISEEELEKAWPKLCRDFERRPNAAFAQGLEMKQETFFKQTKATKPRKDKSTSKIVELELVNVTELVKTPAMSFKGAPLHKHNCVVVDLIARMFGSPGCDADLLRKHAVLASPKKKKKSGQSVDNISDVSTCDSDSGARQYTCAECGKSPKLGAIDPSDDLWYCKPCWEDHIAANEEECIDS